MVTGFLFLSGVILVLYFLGPKVEIDTTIHPHVLPENLEEYLEKSEAGYPDIVEGAEKKIIWNGLEGVQTPLSVVYLHGFSACRQEVAPLSEIVAKRLGANLFYTRFTGHGRGSQAMTSGSVNAWLNDAWEAIEIGSRIGEKVVVIGLSTGGSVATWLATTPIADKVSSFVLISPNYGLTDRKAELLTLPWGKQVAELILGPEYGWEPYNEQYAKYWTHRFPTKALIPMMGVVRLVRKLDLDAIEKPVLGIYSPDDEVVSSRAIEEKFSKIGSRDKQLVPCYEAETPSHHVLAGDILAPGSTRFIADMIVNFVVRVK